MNDRMLDAIYSILLIGMNLQAKIQYVRFIRWHGATYLQLWLVLHSDYHAPLCLGHTIVADFLCVAKCFMD